MSPLVGFMSNQHQKATAVMPIFEQRNPVKTIGNPSFLQQAKQNISKQIYPDGLGGKQNDVENRTIQYRLRLGDLQPQMTMNDDTSSF